MEFTKKECQIIKEWLGKDIWTASDNKMRDIYFEYKNPRTNEKRKKELAKLRNYKIKQISNISKIIESITNKIEKD
jgi:hypothetical protein